MERKKSKALTILALGLIFMIAFTVVAFQILFWQNSDLSVDIVSDSDEDSNEVVISVQNTAGATLLFYENAEMTGKIEYLSEDGWVEYCDVSYTNGNVNAFSQQYGGIFAELAPGESWDVAIPEDKVSEMENGTYRVVFTYITADNYKDYLDDAFDDRDIISDESNTVSDTLDATDSGIIGIVDKEDDEDDEEKESFFAESESKVFIKTFEYVASVQISNNIDNESERIPIVIRPEAY